MNGSASARLFDQFRPGSSSTPPFRLLVMLVTVGLLAIAPASLAQSGAPQSGQKEAKKSLGLGGIAGNAAPLHTEKVRVGDRVVDVGFFMWPIRSGQPALLYVEGEIDPATTELWLVPAEATNAIPGRARSEADGAMKNLSWHEVNASVRGPWRLEVRAGGQTAALPIEVAGPPSIPIWLGWMIGLSPLVGLFWFLRRLRAMVQDTPLEAAPWWTSASNRPEGAP